MTFGIPAGEPENTALTEDISNRIWESSLRYDDSGEPFRDSDGWGPHIVQLALPFLSEAVDDEDYTRRLDQVLNTVNQANDGYDIGSFYKEKFLKALLLATRQR